MTDTPDTTAINREPSLLFPVLRPFYSRFTVVADTLLRIVAGLALMVHGWPKIIDPLGRIDMVESIGFWPGVVWSPALAVTEFVGGLLLVIGLFTRPAAAAATVVLLVTVWFHWVHLEQGYAGAELSILWSAILFRFSVAGGGKIAIDNALPKQL